MRCKGEIHFEGGKALAQVVQGSCGHPIPASVQSQVGLAFGQRDLVGDAPGYGREVGTRWSLRSLAIQTILWLCKVLCVEVSVMCIKSYETYRAFVENGAFQSLQNWLNWLIEGGFKLRLCFMSGLYFSSLFCLCTCLLLNLLRMYGMRDPPVFIPAPVERYRQILLPALQLCQVILTSSMAQHLQAAGQVCCERCWNITVIVPSVKLCVILLCIRKLF